MAHPGTLAYPVVTALWGSIQEDGDMREGQVLKTATSPVLVLLVTCSAQLYKRREIKLLCKRITALSCSLVSQEKGNW